LHIDPTIFAVVPVPSVDCTEPQAAWSAFGLRRSPRALEGPGAGPGVGPGVGPGAGPGAGPGVGLGVGLGVGETTTAGDGVSIGTGAEIYAGIGVRATGAGTGTINGVVG